MKREAWLPATPASASRARAIVRELGRERGLSQEDTWDLMLATTEAVANVIHHGTPCGRRGFMLSVQSCGDGVNVEICDCGTFSPAIHKLPAPESVGGRGIPLIAAISDLFEVVPGADQTRVRFGKRVAAA
jgi:anti-sigma regulatory factor (Ser/Thr protein kinase)